MSTLSSLTILVPDMSQSSISLHTVNSNTSVPIPPPLTLESGQTSTISIKPAVEPESPNKLRYVHSHSDNNNNTPTPPPTTPRSPISSKRPKPKRIVLDEDDPATIEHEEKLKKFRVITILWLVCAFLAFLGCVRASTVQRRYDHEQSTYDLSQCVTTSARHARVVVELRDWGIVCAIATVLHSITFIVFQYFYVVHGNGIVSRHHNNNNNNKKQAEYESVSQTVSISTRRSRGKWCNKCVNGGVWVVSAVGILALITWPMTVIGLMIHADYGVSKECEPINKECWTIISLLIPSIVDFVWIMSSIANNVRLDGQSEAEEEEELR